MTRLFLRQTLIFLPFLFSTILGAQVNTELSSGEIYNRLQKANTLGSVLYIAAHPDDENTRLITYLANREDLRTAYLSLTRGDGGQNLIGTEIGAEIGVLRTQELLAARRIDGGEQYFTRAVDFGYSKSAKETMEKWDREKILADMVWVIRSFKPDVIITRFPTESYSGHGHHTASAILAEEAFDLAGDPNSFPEQLKHVQPWQATRHYVNVSSWWNKNIENDAKGSPDYVTMDAGEYSPLLGKSYAEIAAKSRSQHKSQGFGAEIPRGKATEYLRYVKGEKADPEKGIMDGVNISWSKIEGGESIGNILNKIIDNYDPLKPQESVAALLEAYNKIQEIDNEHWRQIKSKELKTLIAACAGIWLESYTDNQSTSPGSELHIKSDLILRSDLDVKVNFIRVLNEEIDSGFELEENTLVKKDYQINLPVDLPNSNAYWLNEPYENTFLVKDQTKIGKPENDPGLVVNFNLTISGTSIDFERPVMYKTVDPVKGEIYSPLRILPALTVNFESEAFIFTNTNAQSIPVKVSAHKDNMQAELKLSVPENWTVSPKSYTLSFSNKDEEKTFLFDVSPGEASVSGNINATVLVGNENYSQSLSEIEYDHIQSQIVLSPAKAELVYINFKPGIERIAYIKGPGDEVAKYLRAVGYTVNEFEASAISGVDLSNYEAVVTGIRAYNTDEDLNNIHDQLNGFVNAGGTLIVQYNTNRGLIADQIGPYSFNISRERVTVEEAEPTFLQDSHKLFNYPNKISQDDFKGWVQERGLYFADEWAPEFTPLIEWNDPGEKPLKGALIVAPYGKGHVVYTGISFFRELPAAVPGAYRLFANILSLSSADDQ